MERSERERFASKRLADHLGGQQPLTGADIARTRLLVAGFPVVAVLAVLAFGVSAGRAFGAVAFFALWVAIQMVVLSPARRRQVLGMPEVESTEG